METPVFSRRTVWLALCVCLGSGLSNPAWAAPVLNRIHLSEEIIEDQKIELKLVLEWPAAEGAYVIKSPESLELTNMKFLGVSQSQETFPSKPGPVCRHTLIYRLLPLKHGQGSTSDFNLLYRNANQPLWKKIPVPPLILDIRPAIPWRRILILLSILAAIVIPFALWLIGAKLAERKREKLFEKDPKQQIYMEAVKKISGFISGYTESLLRMLLSEWSAEFAKVVMTCYDIPVRPATKTEILKELRLKNVRAAEIQEIEDLFNKLEHLKFSTEVVVTSRNVEEIKRVLLPYIKGKIIIGVG